MIFKVLFILSTLVVFVGCAQDEPKYYSVANDYIVNVYENIEEYSGIETIEIDFSLGRIPFGDGVEVLIELEKDIFNVRAAEFRWFNTYYFTEVMNEIEIVEFVRKNQPIHLRSMYHVGTVHRFGILFDDEDGNTSGIHVTQSQKDGTIFIKEVEMAEIYLSE